MNRTYLWRRGQGPGSAPGAAPADFVLDGKPCPTYDIEWATQDGTKAAQAGADAEIVEAALVVIAAPDPGLPATKPCKIRVFHGNGQQIDDHDLAVGSLPIPVAKSGMLAVVSLTGDELIVAYHERTVVSG